MADQHEQEHAPETFDYSGYTTQEAPSDDKLTRLRQLGEEMLRREAAVKDAESALQDAKMALSDITEIAIPRIMQEVGIDALQLQDGNELRLKEVLAANISAERADAAHRWLEENGQGGLIKRRVIVSFSREQESQAKKLIANLNKYKTPMPYMVDRKVEPPTLKKAVAEMKEAGALTPEAENLFGVYTKKVATFAAKRGSKSKKSDPF